MSEDTPIPLIRDSEGFGRHQPLACPYACGYVMDATMGLTHPGTLPDPGDVSMCGGCGMIMEWAPTQGYVPLAPATRAALIREQPADWAALMVLQAQTRAYRELPPPAAGKGEA